MVRMEKDNKIILILGILIIISLIGLYFFAEYVIKKDPFNYAHERKKIFKELCEEKGMLYGGSPGYVPMCNYLCDNGTEIFSYKIERCE